MDTIRIGIIGAGGITHGHAKRLLAIDGVKITALAEPSQASVESFNTDIFPDGDAPTVYTEYRDLLAQEELDAVLIASPHTCHFDQIMDSLDAGLHVLAEKPMVCSTEDCLKVIEKTKAAGRHLVVSYQRRFQSQFRYMKQFITSPEFGRINVLSAFQSQAWLVGTAGKWRQKLSLSGGGQINDSGSHIVDVLMWALPEPVTAVSCINDNRGTEVDIDSQIIFRTAAGTLGSLTVLGSAPHQGMVEDITISGDKGCSLYIRRGVGDMKVMASREVKGALEDISEEMQSCGSTDPDTHFIQLLRGEVTENESAPENFLPTIQFTEACWRSAEQGGKFVEIKPA